MIYLHCNKDTANCFPGKLVPLPEKVSNNKRTKLYT